MRRKAYLETVASVCFSIDHFNEFVGNLLTCSVALCPVVTGTASCLAAVDVFWIVQVLVWTREDIVDNLDAHQGTIVSQNDLSSQSCSERVRVTYSWLEIDQDSSWNVMLVVCLVEEDIFAVAALLLGSVLFQCTILCDSMLATEVLPKVRSDLVSALTGLEGDEFSGHVGLCCRRKGPVECRSSPRRILIRAASFRGYGAVCFR